MNTLNNLYRTCEALQLTMRKRKALRNNNK